MITCSKCGAVNADDSIFCQSCGNDLRNTTVTGGTNASTGGTSSFGSSTGGSAIKAAYKMSSAFGDAIALVRSPVAFMNANKDNDVAMRTLLINYVAVLAAVPFIATLIGDSWYYRFLSIYGGAGFGYVFGIAILSYIFSFVEVYVVGYIMWKLAPNFGATTTQIRATRMAAYVFTPAFLLSIFDIVPFLGIIVVLGVLYGLYIMYLGLPILLNAPRDKVLTYLIVIVVVTIVVYAIVGAIIGAIVAAILVTSFGLFAAV
jgi:hypothetical protein